MEKKQGKFAVTENGRRVVKGTYTYLKFENLTEAEKVLGKAQALKLLNDEVKKVSRDLASEAWKKANNPNYSDSTNAILAEAWKKGELSKTMITKLQAKGFGKPEDLLASRTRTSERQKLVTKLRKSIK